MSLTETLLPKNARASVHLGWDPDTGEIIVRVDTSIKGAIAGFRVGKEAGKAVPIVGPAVGGAVGALLGFVFGPGDMAPKQGRKHRRSTQPGAM